MESCESKTELFLKFCIIVNKYPEANDSKHTIMKNRKRTKIEEEPFLIKITYEKDATDIEELIKSIRCKLIKLISKNMKNLINYEREKIMTEVIEDSNCSYQNKSIKNSRKARSTTERFRQIKFVQQINAANKLSINNSTKIDKEILLNSKNVEDDPANVMSSVSTAHDSNCDYDSDNEEDNSVEDEVNMYNKEDMTRDMAKPPIPLPETRKSTDNIHPNTLLTVKSNGSDEFRCEICERNLTTKGSLKRHISHQHALNKVRTFTCHKCQRVFNNLYSLNIHKQTHLNQLPSGKFSCQSCFKQFVSRSTYLVHARLGVCGPPAFSCDPCAKYFTQEKTFNIHMKRHIINTKNSDSYIRCNKCNQTFSSKNGFRKHTQKATCLSTFVCQKCNKTFKQQNLLKAHLQSHVSQNPENGFRCTKCLRLFATQRGFNAHEKQCSTKQNVKRKENLNKSSNYICEICGKNFTQSSSLHKHTRKHSTIRPYKCQPCGKCFYDQFGLQVHTRIHTGDKPYLCNVCGKSFISNSKLKRHIKSHDKQSTKSYRSESTVRNIEARLKKQEKESSDFQHPDIRATEVISSQNVNMNQINNTMIGPAEMIPEYTKYDTPSQNKNYSTMDNFMTIPKEKNDYNTSTRYFIDTSFNEQIHPDNYHYNIPPPPYPGPSYIPNTDYNHDNVSDVNDYHLLEFNSYLPSYNIYNVSEHISTIQK
ncbi:zinc finger protein 568 [Patella vulgata]|uniref:zinc finger protein 568 n=1 Tax=Patella vulgata TaxID=6465 RepID=UPI0024A928A7|nr:zinc finger protein 568 [Patella vulgata]